MKKLRARLPFAEWKIHNLPAPPNWEDDLIVAFLSADTEAQSREHYRMLIFFMLTVELGEDEEIIYDHFDQLTTFNLKDLKQFTVLKMSVKNIPDAERFKLQRILNAQEQLLKTEQVKTLHLAD